MEKQKIEKTKYTEASIHFSILTKFDGLFSNQILN